MLESPAQSTPEFRIAVSPNAMASKPTIRRTVTPNGETRGVYWPRDLKGRELFVMVVTPDPDRPINAASEARAIIEQALRHWTSFADTKVQWTGAGVSAVWGGHCTWAAASELAAVSPQYSDGQITFGPNRRYGTGFIWTSDDGHRVLAGVHWVVGPPDLIVDTPEVLKALGVKVMVASGA